MKLLSVTQVVERGVDVRNPNDFDVYKENYHAIPTKTFYIGALEFRFEVLEYLKGSGSSEIVGVVGDSFNEYDTMEEAQADNLLDIRSGGLDDTEAIVFLHDSYDRDTGWGFPSIQQPDRYELGILREPYSRGGGDAYSIYSRHSKNWLPAKAPEGASGASGASGSGGQQFLTGGVPVNMFQDGVSGASGASGDSSVMTLSDLKRRISEIEEELNEGDGSEEYRECVYAKYKDEREIRYHKARNIGEHLLEIEVNAIDFESGWHQGRRVFEDSMAWRRDQLRYLNQDSEFWVEGRDADLFGAEFPGIAFAKRPLPMGEYRFFFNELPYVFIVCDGQPDSRKNDYELRVNVIAPDGTLHESFFDPVDIGTAVGTDGTDGVLEPASFSSGGGDTTIQRIEWDGGRVRMQFDPPGTLTDHHIDFIALDGSVSLRLDFDDAVSVSDEDTGDVLTWGVCEQPWQSGDLLMLRISRSEPGLTDVTNDADCAAAPDATPTPEPIPTAIPTPAPDAIFTPTATPMFETTPNPTPTTIAAPEPTQTATPAPVALTPPSKPLNLTASTQDNSITLTWDDPDDSTITGYLIFRRQPNIDRQFTLIADTTGMPTSSYTDTTNIEQGKRYLYRVRAVNNAGQSAASEAAVVETASLLPAAPQNLSAVATHSTVTLSWDGLDASITGYQILRRVAGDPAGFMVIVEDTGTSESVYVDAVGVEPATHYIYRVVGINDEGLGKPSLPVQAMTLEVPSEPTATPTTTVMPTATPEPDDGVSGAIDTPTPTPTPEPDDGVSGAIDTPTPVPTPEPTATPTPEPDDGVSGAIDPPTPTPTPEPDGVGGAVDAPAPTPSPTSTPEPAEGVSGA